MGMSNKFTSQDIEIIEKFFPENGANHCGKLINKENISCKDVKKAQAHNLLHRLIH
jgi:hypothetical protein